MNNIYFGKVVDVKDEEKINRVRISIPGYTDEIPIDQLPWYFPFFGLKYLPIVGDNVPVFIFNNNFTHGFYNNKIDLKSNGLDGTEYENYVELYKRLGVQATYKESEGWLFINKDSKIQINEKQIDVISKKINHNSGKEQMVLGNTLVDTLDKLINAILKLTVQTPSGPSSTPINAQQFKQVQSKLNNILSKLSNIE
jgi:hypothetical protein